MSDTHKKRMPSYITAALAPGAFRLYGSRAWDRRAEITFTGHAGRVRHHLAAVVTGSDDAATKPAPDMVDLAVERAGGGKAIVIGDAVWDVLSAEAAGVPCIGLRSGGMSAERLSASGASQVYDGPRDLLDHLEGGPLTRQGSSTT